MGRPKNPNNILHKLCPTCSNEFTCEKRKEKTYCCKKCSANAPEIKEKNRVAVAAAFEEKYGGHPMAVNEETKNRLKETMLAVHGVDHNSKLSNFVTNVKRTKLEKYGNENFNNLDAMKSTCVEKYGVDNYSKTEEYKHKYIETCTKKYGVEHVSKTPHFKDSHKNIMFEKFMGSQRFQYFSPEFTFDEYCGVTKKFNRKYPFKCKRCEKVEDQELSNGRFPLCTHCDKLISGFHVEITDYLKEILPVGTQIVNNDRTTIHPLELDVFIPSLNIAIEVNGTYWHSEVSGGKNRTYHLNKTKLCAKKGVRLIHVFEYEWGNKQEIVKSVLRSIFAKNRRVIYARKCTVKNVEPNVKSKFLNENHLQGNDHSTIKLGLYSNDELLTVMTFVKSRFDKKIEWELSRLCTKIGVSVVGGASKLMSHFIKICSPKNIVSYCDRRYFGGEVYLQLGFDFIDNTQPNYYYIIDSYDAVENRINWQKSKLSRKLKTFDPPLSEWENMKINGFDRIWDCGHSKWVWKSQKTS
jgi:hypothetical protein